MASAAGPDFMENVRIGQRTVLSEYDSVNELIGIGRSQLTGSSLLTGGPPPRVSDNSALLHSGLGIEGFAEERESNVVYNRVWHTIMEVHRMGAG